MTQTAYYLRRLTEYAYAIGAIRSIIHADNDVETIRRRCQQVINQLEANLEEHYEATFTKID